MQRKDAYNRLIGLASTGCGPMRCTALPDLRVLYSAFALRRVPLMMCRQEIAEKKVDWHALDDYHVVVFVHNKMNV